MQTVKVGKTVHTVLARAEVPHAEFLAPYWTMKAQRDLLARAKDAEISASVRKTDKDGKNEVRLSATLAKASATIPVTLARMGEVIEAQEAALLKEFGNVTPLVSITLPASISGELSASIDDALAYIATLKVEKEASIAWQKAAAALASERKAKAPKPEPVKA